MRQEAEEPCGCFTVVCVNPSTCDDLRLLSGGGMWAVCADAWCCDGLTSATPSVDFATPRSLCLSGGGLQTTRPNFRVAVLLKYRSNAHDVVEGTYADDPGPIGSLRKLLGGR